MFFFLRIKIHCEPHKLIFCIKPFFVRKKIKTVEVNLFSDDDEKNGKQGACRVANFLLPKKLHQCLPPWL